MEDNVETEAGPRQGGRSSRKWVWLAITGFLLVAVAGGVLWFVLGEQPAATEAGGTESESGATGLVAPEPFLANLAGGSQYARVTLRLVIGNEEAAKKIAADELAKARVRSVVLDLLMLQHADRLMTSDGKAELKKAIADRTGAILGEKVHDVLFTDFVVQ